MQTLFKLIETYLFLFILILSFTDIKEQEIPLKPLILGGVLGILLKALIQPLTLKEWMLGIIIGCFFLFISKVSKEGIGYADSNLLFIMALCLGGTKIMVTFIIASILVLLVAGILLISKIRINRKFRLPFYPFLAVSYFIGNWLL